MTLSLTQSLSQSLLLFTLQQAAISWRASGNRQISLNASAERAFANFRDKKHRILQLQIFVTKNIVFYNCKFSRQKRRFYTFLQQNPFFLQILQQKTVVFYNCMKTNIFTVLQSSQMILVHMLQ